MAQTPQSSALDLIPGNATDATGPAGTVRITRTADGLQASVDGGAPAAIGTGGGGDGAGSLVARALAASNITLSGAQTIDGVSVVATNLVLVIGQTDASENGYYVASAGAWARSTDFDEADEMTAGKTFVITEGTVYASSMWAFATTGVVDPGTTDLAFAIIGPSFGADTRVSLPNAGGTMVQAMRILTQLYANTPDAEGGVVKISVITAGIETDAVYISVPSIYLPDNWFFVNDQDTGVVRNGADNYSLHAGANNVVDVTPGGLALNSGIGAQLSWGATHGAVNYSSGTGRITVVPDDAQGNVQLGLNGGAALTTGATHGFAAIQTCAGTPSGAPSADTGFAPIVVDTSGGKLWAYYGAAWHDLTGL